MNPRLEDDLRRMLENRAAAVPHSPDPYRTTRQQIARAKRRRATALLTAGVCLALTAAVPVQRFVFRPHQDPLLNANGKPFPVLDWPTRGSLAHDRGFQDAACGRVRDRSRTGEPLAGAGMCRVLYAHDDGKLRFAILAYLVKDNSATELATLYGPADRPVTQFKSEFSMLNSKRQAPITTLIEVFGGRITSYLVLGPPEVRTVEISPREEPLADGTVRREWRSFPAPEGAAYAAGLPAASGPHPMRIRLISEDGSAEYPAFPEQKPGYDPGPIPGPPASDPLVNKPEFRKALAHVATRYVVPAATLRTKVLWAGSTGGYSTIVLAVTLPSGGAVQAVHHYGRLVGNRTRIRVVPTADAATKPVGWSHVTEQPVPGRTGEVTTGLYAAPYPGLLVEVREGSRTVTTGSVRGDGLALMPRFRTAEAGISARLTYRIVDPAGKIAHEDRLDF